MAMGKALLLAGVLVAVHSAPATPPQAGREGAPRSAARHVDRARLMRDLTTLSAPAFEGRATGTPGGERARQWIETQFAASGVAPATPGGYTQPFSVSPGALRGANVVGRLRGRVPDARAIVLTAHYDHLGIRNGVVYPGADDNASGVAVLLAAARLLTARPPRHPIIVAALDAEERGLRGARTLVASDLLPRGGVALNINLDMVSRSDANEMFAAGSYHSPWQIPILNDVQQRTSVRIRLGHDRPAPLANGLDDWTHQSDHGAFHDAGIPFVYFGVEDHPDYHTPTDTAGRVDPQFFGDAADMIVEAIRTFDARLPVTQ